MRSAHVVHGLSNVWRRLEKPSDLLSKPYKNQSPRQQNGAISKAINFSYFYMNRNLAKLQSILSITNSFIEFWNPGQWGNKFQGYNR